MSDDRKRPYHHGDLRAALLREAMELLERDGPEAISFRAVARAVGVSATAPYNHFTSRHDLLAAIATVGFDDFAARQESAAKATRSARTRLIALGRAYLDFAVGNPQLYRLMFGAGVAHWRAEPEVAAAKRRSIEPLRAAIAQAAPRQAEAEAATMASWSVAHGLAMLIIDGSLDHAAEEMGGPDRLIDNVLRWSFGRQEHP